MPAGALRSGYRVRTAAANCPCAASRSPDRNSAWHWKLLAWPGFSANCRSCRSIGVRLVAKPVGRPASTQLTLLQGKGVKRELQCRAGWLGVAALAGVPRRATERLLQIELAILPLQPNFRVQQSSAGVAGSAAAAAPAGRFPVLPAASRAAACRPAVAVSARARRACPASAMLGACSGGWLKLNVSLLSSRAEAMRKRSAVGR